MGKSLLTIDWDYFVNDRCNQYMSYMESEANLLETWYKRYFEYKQKGEELANYYELDPVCRTFWKSLGFHGVNKKKSNDELPVVVTESHEAAYEIAVSYDCNKVYSFDAHSDLGYGGIKSLEFEVNCANWLGKLLVEEKIEEAGIVYSPYTKEHIQDFEEIVSSFKVNFINKSQVVSQITSVGVIHICRSGPWTPPWFDETFEAFIQEINSAPNLHIPSKRHWEPEALSLGEQINCLLGII